MKVYGFEITDEVIEKMKAELLSRESFTFGSAHALLVQLGVSDSLKGNLPSSVAYRGADRILQGMRKNGLIECTNRKTWKPTGAASE